MTNPIVDEFMKASRSLALGVKRGTVTKQEAASAIGGLIVASGIEPDMIKNEAAEILKMLGGI